MITINEENITEYLRSIGQLPADAASPRTGDRAGDGAEVVAGPRAGAPAGAGRGDGAGEGVAVRSLGGGVSNVVLRVTGPGLDMVVKQALPKLNVAEEWLADIDRVEKEVACLKLLMEGLADGSVPKLLFYDKANYSYGMEMLPERYRMWKSDLLGGEVRQPVAERVGEMLGEIHALTWNRSRIGDAFDDVLPFTQLRIDAYYRTTGSRHPDFAHHFERVIEMALGCRQALVHGDYSPKNILVDPSDHVVLLDYEVAHFGDPAFDAAFLLNHLMLKAMHVPQARSALCASALSFWGKYLETLKARGVNAPTDLEARTVSHLGCLQLARIDGKSPAEYIVDTAEKEAVRRFAKEILADGLARISDVVEKMRLR